MARPQPTPLFIDTERALNRMGAYLGACGVDLDRETSLVLLSLVQEGLQNQAGDDLIDWLMNETRRRFEPLQTRPALTAPPIQRGSIHYHRR